MDRRSDSTAKLRFGAFEADFRSGELWKGGDRVRLQEQPLRILALLLQNPGEVVTREALCKALWPDHIHVDFENGLNIAVKKLRQALGDAAEIPTFIETLPRRGYRFIAPVTKTPDSSGAGTGAPVEAELAISARISPRRVTARIAIGLAAFAVVAAAIVGAIGWRNAIPGAKTPFRIRSVAVLPLQNLSGDPAQEYFADGMTEDLITDLAQIGALRVISRTSSMAYKRTRKTAPVIARELNVDAVIEGAVAHSGGRVRVTAQLIDAAQDRHLWAASYERDVRDVLSVQDAVARDIANQVRIRLTGAERLRLSRPRPVNPRAYEAYLKGRYHLAELTQGGLGQSLAHLRQAIAIDPKYAPAYTALAYYYLAQAGWGLSPLDALRKARDATEAALRLDDSLAEAHADLAVVRFWYEWDWHAAESEFKKALALDSNDARTRALYAGCLAWAGKPGPAIAQATRAIGLDPVSPDTARILGEVYYFSRRYAPAIVQLRKAVRMDPTYWFAHLSLGRAYLQGGQSRQAIGELEAAARLAPDMPDALSALANAYGRSGAADRAKGVLARLQRMAQGPGYVAPYYFAIVYAGLGQTRVGGAGAGLPRALHLHDLAEDRPRARFPALQRRIPGSRPAHRIAIAVVRAAHPRACPTGHQRYSRKTGPVYWIRRATGRSREAPRGPASKAAAGRKPNQRTST